ncbi:MAG: PIN domain-containing protein [Desulfobacula sp.]|jgi:predicted nucleic acid-binding protein|nr:PIN domain-containing protein [Desulfobacula sp.]
MNILFDTNVILDVMLDRTPFSAPAGHLLSLVEQGEISGFICATTVTTIHYLATKIVGKEQTQNQIKNLTILFDIAPVNRPVIEDALKSKFTDFEDAVIYQSARHAGAEAIVTRDVKGFKKSELPVYSPTEMLKILDTID